MAPRLITLFLLTLATLPAQRITLYLEGGGDMLVREYQVQQDRVRYYSIERSQWEEIPLELVDLEKTEKAHARTEARREAMRRESAAERAAEAKARTELHNVPIEEGVYHYKDGKTTTLQQREVLVEKSTKRGILQAISPVKVIAGKRTRYLEGESSSLVVSEEKPILYIRDATMMHFLLVKLSLKKGNRVVQLAQVVPATGEIFEEHEEIEVFRQQYAAGVYRTWPVQPLEAGEYAIIDFTPGEDNLRVWDFSVRLPAGSSTPQP